MTYLQKSILRITLLFLFIQLSIALALAMKGHSQFIPNVLGPAILWVIYTILEFRFDVYINTYVRSVAMVATVSDCLFGYYCNYYLTSGIFDKIQHVFGTYAAALLVYWLIIRWLKQSYSQVSVFILVLALGISIGAVYEIGEFLGDLINNPVNKSQPSLLDTNLDMIGDIIGAAIAAIHAVYRERNKVIG